jgi:hypothetical protein
MGFSEKWVFDNPDLTGTSGKCHFQTFPDVTSLLVTGRAPDWRASLLMKSMLVLLASAPLREIPSFSKLLF